MAEQAQTCYDDGRTKRRSNIMSHSGTVSKPHPYGWPADGADGVEVLVHSVQQPQQELLGVVLSVPFKLRGVFGHRVLQRAFGMRLESHR